MTGPAPPAAPPARGLALAAWLVRGLAALNYAYAFFQRMTPGAMAEDLMRDFGVSAAALGNLAAVYFYAYAAVQLPAGVLYDRFGPRWILAGAAASCALAAALALRESHPFRTGKPAP